MNLGNVARVFTLCAACVAAVGSASSNTNNGPATQPQYQQSSPPPAQQMDAGRALGLWRSNFGAVKIEADNAHGGIAAGAVQGVWMYQRQGQDVIGYFYGTLSGNVLQFRWQEPGNPPLTGAGYIQFELSGRQYNGRWWSDKHDRVGDWNGYRQADGSQQQFAGFGGAQYGGQPQPQAPQQPSQYPQQPSQYPQQPSQYPPQQYPQQPPQQPYPQQPQQYPPQQYPQQQYPQQQAPQQYPPQQQYSPQQYPPPAAQPTYPQGQHT